MKLKLSHLLFLLSARASRCPAPRVPRRTSARVASALSAHAGHTTAYATGNANPPRDARAFSARWCAKLNGDVSSINETSDAKKTGVRAIAVDFTVLLSTQASARQGRFPFGSSLLPSLLSRCETDRHTGASATVVGHASGKLKNVTAAVDVAADARATHFNVTQGGSLGTTAVEFGPPPSA